MKTIKGILDKILHVLAGVSLCSMVLLTCWQVLTRYILGNPSTWSEELVGYLFAWSTMFGATIVSAERGHMNIPIFIDKLGDRARKGFHILSEAVACLFSLSILVFGGVQITNLAMGQMTSSLGVAVGVFYVVLPVCGTLISVYSIINIIGIAKGCVSLDSSNEASEAIAKAESEPVKGGEK
jgi:TRAP-type C4-dicarboxylate transport system permease small subunit